MMLRGKKVVWTAVALAVLGAYLSLGGPLTQPALGDAVTDAEAASARGGFCQNVSLLQCSSGNCYMCFYYMCPACWYVASGPQSGSPFDSCWCSSSCGSRFGNYTLCGGS